MSSKQISHGDCSQLAILREPQCLVETDEDGKLACVAAVAEEVSLLDGPLVVVAIAGLYRTGKSYLMNRIARKNTGFSLGSTIEAKTKGIWVFALRHPRKSDHFILLMDTEGLGDAFKGDRNHDTHIFCLVTLMSSVLVYNGMEVIDMNTIDQLQFVAEMSQHIRSKNTSPSGSDDDFDWHFPNLILALRDFSKDLVVNGEEISSDEYFQYCLELRDDKSPDSEQYNLPRRCIKKYFRNRKCFTFDRPAGRSGLKKLEELKDEDLSRDFVEETTVFCTHIYEEAPVKHLSNGRVITGSMWTTLLKRYVEHIRLGAVPCIGDAVSEMAQLENEEALRRALALYHHLFLTSQRERVANAPESTEETLDSLHVECLSQALTLFGDISIFDENEAYLKEVIEQIENEHKSLRQGLDEAWLSVCNDLLSNLNISLSSKINIGYYHQSRGYKRYQADIQSILEVYKAITCMELIPSTIVERALDIFKVEQTDVSGAILASDTALCEREREIEASKERAAIAEHQRLIEEQYQKQTIERTRQVEAEVGRTMAELEIKRHDDIARADERRKQLESRAQADLASLQSTNVNHLQSLRDELNRLR